MKYLRSIIGETKTEKSKNEKVNIGDGEEYPKRDTWGSGWEFLMSCISVSVGLGNILIFPFTALEFGGGAFLIPYIIVMFLVGKPIYYMELVIGQFSSSNSVKAFDFSPISRGIGVGQLLATFVVTGYFAVELAIIIHYFVTSFYPELPWSHCRPEWNTTCFDSAGQSTRIGNNETMAASSAELYFYKEVLKQKETLDGGIGSPDLHLALCMLLTWVIISAIMIKGIKSYGKASYFLALLPYFVLTILFIRAVTLPGAMSGIMYLYKPQWDKLTDPMVWYAAVSQSMFSLGICFGTMVMLASYNKSHYNIYRDVNIVIWLDTFTSLFAATSVFAILGNLAYENGTDEIDSKRVLAFVSYPNAISKFHNVPQLFSVLFFFMLFVLGLGTIVGSHSVVFTVIKDQFTQLSPWKIVLPLSTIQFLIGLVYVTPGGQHLYQLTDFIGPSFLTFFLNIAQLITLAWIYGVKRLCLDVGFMLNKKTGLYWRICWAVITPAILIAILIFNIIFSAEYFMGCQYPSYAFATGWITSAVGLIPLPVWAIYAVYNQTGNTLLEKIKAAARPSQVWGPKDTKLQDSYQQLIANQIKQKKFLRRVKDNIFG